MKRPFSVRFENQEEMFDFAQQVYYFEHKQTRSKKPLNYYLFYQGLCKRNYIYCQCCMLRSTEIHHIDFNQDHNQRENLAFLCKKCHVKIHYYAHQEFDRDYFLRNPLNLSIKPIIPDGV